LSAGQDVRAEYLPLIFIKVSETCGQQLKSSEYSQFILLPCVQLEAKISNGGQEAWQAMQATGA